MRLEETPSRDGVEFGGGVIGAENESRSGGVRVAVGGDEFAVGGGVAGDGGDEVCAEVVGDFFDEVEFLVGEAGGGDDGDLVGLAHLEAFGDFSDGLLPGGLGVLSVFFQKRIREAFVGVEVVEVEPVGVGHPSGVDFVVLAGGDAVDFVAAGPDAGVGAGAAVGVDAFGFLEEPDAHLEAEVVGGEGADGADVCGVEGVVVIEFLPGVDGEGGVGAALGEAEDGVVGDFVHEADAAGAHDASLVVEADVFSDIDVFGLLDFCFLEAGFAASVFDGKFLERAFAGLVADGAVERVVDEEEFHDALAAGLDEFARGADAHVFGDGVGAGDDGAGHPADFLVAVVSVGGVFAGGGTWRHAHLDKAHAAVAGGGKFGVVAVVGDFFFGLFAGFDHAGALGDLDPVAVDLHVDEALFGSKVFRELLFGGGRGFFAHFRALWVMPGEIPAGGTMTIERAGVKRLCEIFHKLGFGVEGGV